MTTLLDLASQPHVQQIWGGHVSIKLRVAHAFLEKKLRVSASRYLCAEIRTCEQLIDEPWMLPRHREKLRAEAEVYLEGLRILDQVAA